LKRWPFTPAMRSILRRAPSPAPIQLSTTFEREADGTYRSGYVYSRSNNPNRRALEVAMAALEGGSDAAAFGSGLAAASGIFHALRPGDHLIAATQTYHGTTKLVRDVFIPWGLDVDFVDMTDLAAVQSAVRPSTKLLWVETPSNPLLKITDIAQVAEIAHAAGALCACDNTFAPILQRPFELGPISWCIRQRNISAAIATSLAASSSLATRANSFPECARCKGAPVPFLRRSIAGWSRAGCGRCRGECARNRKTR
jgi:hypothetical protein